MILTQNFIFFFFGGGGRIVNIVGKGENAGYQYFLLFLQCFLKLSFSEVLKVGILWKRLIYACVVCLREKVLFYGFCHRYNEKDEILIVRRLTPFQQYFSYMAAASAPIHAFLEFFQPVFRTLFLPNHWLLSQITIVGTTDSSERGMNPVAMTIGINPRKEYWPRGGIEPATSCSQVHNATD